MKLGKFYTIDECNDIGEFLETLNRLSSEGKINFYEFELGVYRIYDIDLTQYEIIELCNRFNELEVYPHDIDFDDFDDFDGSGYSYLGDSIDF